MASRRNERTPRRSSGGRRPSGRSPQRRPRHASPRRRATVSSGFSLTKLIQNIKFRREAEFRPDSLENSFFEKLYMTKLQRLHFLKCVCLILLCIGLLVVQDVIMSRISIFGTTTDLVACVILLITVMEGIDVGSIFVVIASVLYQFSGFAPGPFSVGLLSIFGILATLFRQAYWHRNRNSILLCAGLALMLYEIGVYVVGVRTGLTNWYRIPSFLITGVLSWIVMIPLYPLIDRIGQIGGNTWRE